jgi:hypothetical protein
MSCGILLRRVLNEGTYDLVGRYRLPVPWLEVQTQVEACFLACSLHAHPGGSSSHSEIRYGACAPHAQVPQPSRG